MEVVPVVATVSTRTIPFAPFVDLLPDGPTPDELSMLDAARQQLATRSGPRGVIVAVDDAPLLDRASLAFLTSIVTSGVATVALTARTGEPMASDLVDLWAQGAIERVDLTGLTEDEARLLVEARLGSVTETLHRELWRLSQGNPLVLHELIEGALGESITQDESQQWDLTGSIVDSPRLADLVSSRVRLLGEHLRYSLEVVALGAPLPIDVADRMLGADLADLEERGLIEIAGEGSGMVVPAHPLYGEVLRAQIPTSRSRVIHRRLVEDCLEVGASVDPLRLAVWQLESGEHIDDEVALAGAREAIQRHHPALAADLLEPLDSKDARVALLMGKSLSYRNLSEEAERVLADVSPTGDHMRAEFASIRAQNLAFGLGRVAEARNLLEVVAAQVDGADLRARLNNERAMISGIEGDFDDVAAASRDVLEDPETSDVSRAAAYVSLTVALGMTADCHGINEWIEQARAVAARARRELPFAPGQVDIMHAMSLVNEGRFSDALALCVERLADDSQHPAMTSTLLGARTLVLIEAGLLVRACESAERAIEYYEHADPFGLKPQTRGLVAMARGMMGDPDADTEITAEELEEFEPRLSLWLARGRAWGQAARGDLDGAAEIVRLGGEEGLKGQHIAWAAMCLHDAVRFGRPNMVVDLLDGIDSSRGARYIETIQQRARAAVDSDPQTVEEVAAAFSEMGAVLHAAETFADASRLWLQNDETAAARASLRSRILERRCERASTPSLVNSAALVTDREIDMVMDAVAGKTSRQIAEERYISVRTVDNHLRSVYRKVDVSGRGELAEILKGMTERGS